MRYDIRATITQSYDPPAGAGRHVLRLMPASIGDGQRLVSGLIALDPAPAERIDRVDFFGNRVVEIAYRHVHEALVFTLTARVDRAAVEPPLDLSPDLSALAGEIAAVHDIGPQAPHHYLGRSERTRPEPEITAYARRQAGAGMTAMAAVLALGRAIHRDMAFDPEATTVETDPIEAFRKRHGVCQDFSQVMIAGLRGLGIPAGYVSGFLRTIPPEGQPRLEGADAMHAWVRAWVGGDCGWIEYDPTNDLSAGGDHVAVAYGRDYADVAPVRGMLRGSGRQAAAQAVDMVPLPA